MAVRAALPRATVDRRATADIAALRATAVAADVIQRRVVVVITPVAVVGAPPAAAEAVDAPTAAEVVDTRAGVVAAIRVVAEDIAEVTAKKLGDVRL